MNKSITLTLILLSITVLCIITIKPVRASGDFWMSKAPVPTARSDLGVAVVNGKIYAIGGSNDRGSFLGVNEMYNPETDRWTAMAPMPTPRYDFGIAVYQNKIYCIGGFSGYTSFLETRSKLYPPYVATARVATGACEVYDPATNTWETKKPMPTARADVCANAAGDRIYLISGFIEYSRETPNGLQYNINEAYNPFIDSWATKAPMPVVTNRRASAVVDDKIYMLSGTTSIDRDNINQIYTPVTNTWSFGENVPTIVRDAAAGATTGINAPKRIYLIGGWIRNSPHAPITVSLNQVYDPPSSTWTTGAPMPTARDSFAVAVVNDTLYAIGGTRGTVPEEGLIYVPPKCSAVNEQYTPAQYTVPASPSQAPSQEPIKPASREPLQTESSPEAWIIFAIAAIAVVGVGLLVYFVKIGKNRASSVSKGS